MKVTPRQQKVLEKIAASGQFQLRSEPKQTRGFLSLIVDSVGKPSWEEVAAGLQVGERGKITVFFARSEGAQTVEMQRRLARCVMSEIFGAGRSITIDLL